jgi:two-component system sensor histidine kinase UhpB
LATLRSTPFFWRVFLLNGLVFLAGVGGLALSPATFAWPLQPGELIVLVVGLAVMIVINAALLRLGLAPLDRLARLMGTVDLLRPGQRLPEEGAGDLRPLVHDFNTMLERLETERASTSAATLSAQEEERARVARELHDEVGQGLTVLLLELSRLGEHAPPSLRPQVRRLLARTRGSLEDVRQIAQRLRPDVLEELGLTAALDALLREFTQLTHLPVARHIAPCSDLPAQVELVIYRIVQEGLTNIARHAGATAVRFVLERSDAGTVSMTLADNGQGLSGNEGGGIRGMRERALLVHAELQVVTGDDGGTCLTLVVPDHGAKRRQEPDAIQPNSAR